MSDKIHLLFGLGNPGKEYKNTYHNIGQECLFFLAGKKRLSNVHPLFSAEALPFGSEGHTFLFVQPKVFMNHSGEAAAAALHYFKLSPESLLVLHDDVDIPIGEFRIVTNRGSAGHHGIDSIIHHLDTKNFSRVRIGIGSSQKKAIEIVLRPISRLHQKTFQGVFAGIQEKLIENA